MPDHNNPSVVSLPYTFPNVSDYPTEVMADRFQAWRYIIKDLVVYLKEYASVQEEIIRQQMRLQQAVGNTSLVGAPASNSHQNVTTRKDEISAVNRFFLPIGNGSIQDIPGLLTKYHQQNVTNATKTLKEINSIIIPKLEELRKDLLVKIKEIKNLQNDFKTNLGKEIQETKSLLSQYLHSMELSTKLDSGSVHHHHGDGVGSESNDPYLVKIKLDRQLKRQLSEEHYLYQAYFNLQNAGGKLESIIVLEIQNYMNQFMGLLDNENSNFTNYLLANLNGGFLLKEANFEWDSFISRNLPAVSNVSALSNNTLTVKAGSFIDLSFPVRKLSDLVIPNFESTLNTAVREGQLERRSKYLKSYSSGWYVLTCNYLHEFKTSDRKKDQHPTMSLPLDSCTVSDHSKDDGKAGGVYKFILSSKLPGGLMNRTHNWVFRTETYKSMIDWYTDIKSLTGLATPSARARHLNKIKDKTATVAGHVSPASHKMSRNSSIASTAVRSLATNNGAAPPSRGHSQPRQRPSSQATSIFNNTRLSPNASVNQSPRLANMINSDGTIIAPVEFEKLTQIRTSRQEENIQQEHSKENPKEQQDQKHEQHQGHQHEQQGHQHEHQHELQHEYQQEHQQEHQQNHQEFLHPVLLGVPQQHSRQVSGQYAAPLSPTSAGLGVNAPAVPISSGYLNPQNIQYYIPPPGNQQPQFYDPIQQQFFTLTPSLPPGLATQPQPQYFPSSPQPPTGEQAANGTQHFQVAPHPDAPYAINTANYFPQYAQQQIPIQHPQQFGDALPLPYPTTSPGASSARLRSQSNASVAVAEKEKDATTKQEPEDNDEVSTLKSRHDLESLDERIVA